MTVYDSDGLDISLEERMQADPLRSSGILCTHDHKKPEAWAQPAGGTRRWRIRLPGDSVRRPAVPALDDRPRALEEIAMTAGGAGISSIALRDEDQLGEENGEQVKGALVTSVLTFVGDRLGKTVRDTVLSALDREDRSRLALVFDAGWYPLSAHLALIEGIATLRESAAARTSLLTSLGRHLADHLSKTVYRTYLRPADPETLLDRLASIHDQTYRPASLDVVVVARGEADLLVREPATTAANCVVKAAFFRRALEVAGAKDVTVRELSCRERGADSCRFRVSWPS